MTETTDGFLISEADMKIRGPGDMEGTQQSGLAFNLKVANLAKDGQILSVAREAAKEMLRGNPGLISTAYTSNESEKKSNNLILSDEEREIVKTELDRRFARNVDWSRIS